MSSTKCESHTAWHDIRHMLYVGEISSDHIIMRQMFVYTLRADHEHYGLLLGTAHHHVFLIPKYCKFSIFFLYFRILTLYTFQFEVDAETKESTRKAEEKLDEKYKEGHERKKPK